ncbi:unnamed protein product, partial [Scytosiphon promiscuus]
GYGWGGAARCALLMASATFLEEVLGIGGKFPRMTAMRCFSASLRCGRAPGGSAGGGGGDDDDDEQPPVVDGEKPFGSSSSSGTNRSYTEAAPAPYALEEPVRLPQGGGGTELLSLSEVMTSESPGGMRLEDLLAVAGECPPGAQLVDSKWRTCCHVPMVGPGGAGLAVVVAQPLSRDTARRLRSQAEQERARGSAACHAVIEVAREHHPDAQFLRDVPPEILDSLVSVGTSRAQQK